MSLNNVPFVFYLYINCLKQQQHLNSDSVNKTLYQPTIFMYFVMVYALCSVESYGYGFAITLIAEHSSIKPLEPSN